MAIESATGIATVGSSGSAEMTITVDFPANFATNPIVVATTLQDPSYSAGSIDDTFAVSITSVSTSGFTANIYRVDNIGAGGGGWGQNLMLNWIALAN
jgi:hypothetical protein